MARKAMILDLNRCVGCLACVVSCKVENDVEVGKYWTSIERVGPTGEFPKNEMYFLPHVCHQCDTPECIRVCPTNATYKRADGIVLVDSELCIGCESCVDACPYGARIMNSEKNVAEKCTLCIQLIDKGEEAHCVANCPGKARMIGDLDDPNDPVSILLKNEKGNFYQLRDVGNKPVGGYVLRKSKWQPK